MGYLNSFAVITLLNFAVSSVGMADDIAARHKVREAKYPLTSNAELTSIWKAATTNGEPLYRLSYQYEFGGVNAIYIKGVGTVPARGKLEYLTGDPNIEFRDSRSGQLLVTLKTAAPYRSLGITLDLPRNRDFGEPPLSREERWAWRKPFQEAAMAAINEKGLLANAYEQEGVSYLVTCYVGLEGVPKNLIGQIAIRVSYPHRRANEADWYRVEYITRERRAREDKWLMPSNTPEVQRTSNAFVDSFVKQLRESGGKPK